MHSDDCRSFFGAFLADRHREDQYLFVRDFDVLDVENRESAIESIIRKYVMEGSEHELNVSPAARSAALTERSERALTNIRSEVIQQMEIESFREFQRSNKWVDMIA